MKQNLKTRMDGHFPDILRLFKNGQKSDSFARGLSPYSADGWP